MNLFSWLRRLWRFLTVRRQPLKVARTPSPVDLEAVLDYIHAQRHKDDTFIVFGTPLGALAELVDRVNVVLGAGSAQLHLMSSSSDGRQQVLRDLQNPGHALRVVCFSLHAATGWRIIADNMHILVLNRVSENLLAQIGGRVRGSGMLYAPANNRIRQLHNQDLRAAS